MTPTYDEVVEKVKYAIDNATILPEGGNYPDLLRKRAEAAIRAMQDCMPDKFEDKGLGGVTGRADMYNHFKTMGRDNENK